MAFYQNNIPISTSINATFTTPSSLSGNIVRIRLMEDLWSGYGGAIFNGASTSLRWGQAEDYPVLLQSSILPLTLQNFTGVKSNGLIHLSWKTANEVHTKNFEVERTANGRDYTTIGTVVAKGDGKEHSYGFADGATAPGTYLYRLKMTDLDGSFTYSKVLNFTINAQTLVQVIENPFKDNIRVMVPDYNGPVQFRLLDVSGRTLYSRNIQSNGSIVELHMAQQALSPGVYILETVVNGETFINKLLKN